MRRPSQLSTILLTVATVVTVGASVARAEDDMDEEQVASYAVQNRRFRLGGELDVAGGILPLNAFNKGLTIGGAFTYHMSNVWAWEVINAAYVIKQLDTGLKKELLDNFDVQPTEISAIDLLMSSNLVLKPFYGKFALFNRRVVHMELSVPFGVALGRFINPSTYLAGPTAGLIFRLFLSPHTSLRLDARECVLFNGSEKHNELHIALGMAFAWGGDER